MLLKDNPGQDVPTQAQVQDWAKQNNVDVDIQVITLGNLQAKVTPTMESGSGPDVMVLQGYGPRLYSDSLLDVSDVAKEIDQKNGGFFDIAKDVGNIDGQWKAIPAYFYMHQVLYRKDVLEKVGEKAPQTWEDFARVAKKIKDAKLGVAPFGVAYGTSDDGNQFVQGVLWSYGSKMISADGKTVTFDSPETVAGLKFVVDLYKNGLTPEGVLAWDDSANNKEMLAGTIAMTVNGSSIRQQAKTQFPDMFPKIGLAVYPKGPVNQASFPNSFSFAVRKGTKYPDQAKSLLKFLFQPEKYGEVITATGGAIGTSLKGETSLPIWQDPDNKAMLDAVGTAHLTGWPGPVTKQAAQVDAQRVLINMVGRVINDKVTPEAAVKEAAQKIQQIYAGK
jgi:multiple sugar transport system substrate-binding protein